MKIANSIIITVFAKEDEDADKIKEKLKSLIPFDIEKENIMIGQKKATGFNEKKIIIFEVMLTKEKHTSKFLENLAKNISDEAKEVILRQLENRIDEECMFYLRFSKKKLLDENVLWITDQGNCFHIKMNIAAFPKRKEIASEIIRKVFKVGEQE